MAMRTLTRDEARTVLAHAERFHRGEITLPPEIVAHKKRIGEATRNAELFLGKLGVVDQGMIDNVVQLKLELDGLYLKWGLS